jgi:hypothetical protein
MKLGLMAEHPDMMRTQSIVVIRGNDFISQCVGLMEEKSRESATG